LTWTVSAAATWHIKTSAEKMMDLNMTSKVVARFEPAAISASLIGPVCQVQSISVFGFVEQNVSVQFTLLYAVGPGPKVGAARIGQTERRATLLDALCSAADIYGFIRTIVYT